MYQRLSDFQAKLKNVDFRGKLLENFLQHPVHRLDILIIYQFTSLEKISTMKQFKDWRLLLSFCHFDRTLLS